MKFLIVDDSKAMRMIVQRTLRQAGPEDAEIVEATDGAEALEVVKTEQPDFILSDWNMPKMDGIDLLKTLRSEGIDTGFGVVTSESTPQMLELAKDAGARFVISKPFTAYDLADALEGVG